MRSWVDTSFGHPRLMVDGQPLAPVTFRSFRPQARYVAEFSALGVQIVNAQVSGNLCSLGVPYSLYGGVWQGPDHYDFAPLAQQLADLAAWSGDRRVLLMLDLNPPPWWLAAHADHPDPFVELGEAASSAVWRREAGDYLRQMLAWCETHHGERIVGYALLGGRTHEWFCHLDQHDGPWKVAAGAAALGRPWPSRAERESTFGSGQFRDPVAQADAVAAWRFHHAQIADLLLHFAATAQDVLAHRKVVGAFFGYLLQFQSRQLLMGGHLAAARVFASPDLDFFLCPANYFHRRADQVSSFMMPVDTLRRHGKLALLEFDHITPTAVPTVEGHPIPGQDSRLPTEAAASGVMGRDVCLALAKGQGLWWFDMFGGWFDADRFRAVVAQAQAAAGELLKTPYRSVAEIAVVVDAESLLYVDGRGDLAQSLLCGQLDGLGRCGAPYDIVLSEDLLDPAWPAEQYRLVLFLNAFRVGPALAAAVARLQRGGRTLAWLYAPGFVGDHGLDPAGPTRLTGLACEQVAAVKSVSVAAPLSPGPHGETAFGFRNEQHPGFVVTPSTGVQVLGRTPEGGIGLAEAACGDSRVVFSAVGPLPGWLLRQLAARAGVHPYAHDDDPLYVSSQVLGLHSARGGKRRVWLPRPQALRALLATRAGGVAPGEVLRPHRDEASGRWWVDVPLEPCEARLFAWEASGATP